MLSPDLESRILQEARAKGLLGTPSEGEARPGEADPAGDGDGIWGTRLALLVESGRMSQEALDALAWDAIGGEAGSWVDPLFKGNAPIGHLPSLGDRYRDLVLLGEGATARVYKALDTLLNRQVALKVLKDEAGPALAEARAQAQVEHPNVCRIYEVGRGYIVMQLVEGPTLARLAPTLGRDAKLRLVHDIALGVHAAHQRGLVHLDLKLNNILVQEAEDGSLLPVVGDFGMMLSGTPAATAWCPMGTPPYTSPEQLAGDPSRLDRRADVYALGMMLYVLLSGTIPFAVHDFQGLMRAMAKDPPVPLAVRCPKVPRDLARIVHRCLEKDPAARYPSAQHLAEDLDRYLRLLPVEAMAGSWVYRLRKFFRRDRRLGWVVGLGLGVLLVSSGWLLRRSAFVAEQADWDHHFQQVVEEMRSFLDHVYRLPAHDIGAELEQAQGYAKAIEDDLARKGRAAQGPGLLALAEARLLLNSDDDQAPVLLQGTWDLGYRTEASRTWLVLTLTRNFMSTTWSIRRGSDPGLSDQRLKEALERYRHSVRTMLEGKGTPEQARLSHLAELAEARAQPRLDPDRFLRIARAYRSRFPDDLEGILEEATALRFKSEFPKGEKVPGSQSWTVDKDLEVEDLRQQAMRLFLKAHDLAPSYPRVYSMMANACIGDDISPTASTPGRVELLDRAGGWLREGLRVSPADPKLVSSYLVFLGDQTLRWRLDQGLDPAPVLAEFQGAYRRCLDSGDGRQVAAALNSVEGILLTFGGFGTTRMDLLERLIKDLSEHTSVLSNQDHVASAIPNLCVSTARRFLEAGVDPGPALDLGARFVDLQRAPASWTISMQLNLVAAEHALLAGRDPSGFLGAAETCFQTYGKPGDRQNGILEVYLRLLQARASRGPEAWRRLEECLIRQVGTGPLPAYPPIHATLAAAKLALARQALAEDRDAGVWLQSVRKLCTEALAGGMNFQPQVLRERLAECCLLEARRSMNPLPLLQEGLQQAQAALAYLQPLDPEELRAGGRPRTPRVGYAIPRQGRTLKIQGELLLAMAELEKQPPSRQRLARQALATFDQSLQRNRNLEKDLAPLMDRARALLPSGAEKGLA